MTVKRIVVGVNEYGLRVGQDHHRAKLPDREVDLIRGLNEEGVPYSVLERVWGVGKSTIAGICQYRRRAQTPVGYRTIRIDVKEREA